jgi:hypothetical protein
MLKTHYLVALFRKNASRSNKNRIQIPDAATGAAAFALTMYGLRPAFDLHGSNGIQFAAAHSKTGAFTKRTRILLDPWAY